MFFRVKCGNATPMDGGAEIEKTMPKNFPITRLVNCLMLGQLIPIPCQVISL